MLTVVLLVLVPHAAATMSLCATTMALLRPPATPILEEHTTMLKLKKLRRSDGSKDGTIRSREVCDRLSGIGEPISRLRRPSRLLIQRIDEGQPWEDFKLGIEGAPAGLLRRLSKWTSSAHSHIRRSRIFSKFFLFLTEPPFGRNKFRLRSSLISSNL